MGKGTDLVIDGSEGRKVKGRVQTSSKMGVRGGWCGDRYSPRDRWE